MASFCFKNAYFMINTVDLSDHVQEINLSATVDVLDETAMGDNSKNKLPGLKDAKFSVTLLGDLTALKTDATLWTIYNGNAAVAFVIKPNGSATGATNPKYTGNAIMTDAPFVSGKVGELALVQCNFEVTGDLGHATSD